MIIIYIDVHVCVYIIIIYVVIKKTFSYSNNIYNYNYIYVGKTVCHRLLNDIIFSSEKVIAGTEYYMHAAAGY